MNEEALNDCLHRLGAVFRDLGDVLLGFSESLSKQVPASTVSEDKAPDKSTTEKTSTQAKNSATQQYVEPASGFVSEKTFQANKSSLNDASLASIVREKSSKVHQQQESMDIGKMQTPSVPQTQNEQQGSMIQRESSVEASPTKSSSLQLTPLKTPDNRKHSSEKKKSKKNKHIDEKEAPTESKPKEKRKRDHDKKHEKKHGHSSEKKNRHFSEKKKQKHHQKDVFEESHGTVSKENGAVATMDSSSRPILSQDVTTKIPSPEEIQDDIDTTAKTGSQDDNQKSKRSRQNWTKAEDELFLESITRATMENPHSTDDELIKHLANEFDGKRSHKQIRNHYHSFKKSGKLPNSITSKED
eukprot:jgi/Galph1/945/GphlegSOOS_G5659.1